MFGSPNTLVASLICGSVGLGLFVYGWRQRSLAPAVGGTLILAVSYFLETALSMCGATVLVLGGTWWLARRDD